MAALTSSGVTVNGTWKEAGTNSRLLLVKDVTLVLSSQGGLTNSVGADLFGMTKIVDCSLFRDSSSVVVGACPSWDREKLVFYALETDGNPADISATVRGIVKGYDTE